MEDDECCANGSPSINKQCQHNRHLSHHSDNSVVSKLLELLLCLPALRQADQLIRQYWTRVHRDNQHQVTDPILLLQQNSSSCIDVGGEGGFIRRSVTADRSPTTVNGGGKTVKMNKLFVEMLEACLR